MASSRLTFRQLHSVHHLLGECQEMGDDHTLWRNHLLQGMCKLVDADLIMHANMAYDGKEKNLQDGGAWGFENGFNFSAWLNVLEVYGMNTKSETLDIVLARLRNEKVGITAARWELIPNNQWTKTFDKQVIADGIGTDAIIQSYYWLPAQSGCLDSATVARSAGRKQFSEHEVKLMAYLHYEVVLLIGGPLISKSEPQPSKLPPRVRQVLQCLLEGEGDKQIASRLALSAHTVNQYTKLNYAHFNVRGRTELLARWIKRRWRACPSAWSAEGELLPYL